MDRTAFNWPRWLLYAVDAALVTIAFFISYYLRYEVQFIDPVDEANFAPFNPYIPYTAIFAVLMLIGNQNAGLYRERRGRTWWDEVFSIGNTATNTALIVMALSFLLRPLVFSRLLIVQAAVLVIVVLGLWRLIMRLIQAEMRRRGIGVERVLVVGAGEIGRSVLQWIVARPDLGYKVIGFVDDNPERGSSDLGRVPALGSVDNLPHIIERQQVDMVIITLPWQVQRKILGIIRECERKHVRVRTVPDLFELNLSQVQVEMLGGIPLLGLNGETRMPASDRVVKRALDIVLTTLALPFVALIVLVASVAIRLDSPGPIFFAQQRVGLNGKPFRAYKFRSMIENAEELHADLIRQTGEDPRHPKIINDPRITRVGRWIRRFSLDELPQVLNILRGEMSWVGPRPAVPQEVELYEPWHRQRLRIVPGLTGLWQVSGRSEIPFEEMCLLDIYYIENWSLGLDFQILLRTVPRVLLAHGAS
jgi:exopolysaccharide biosynthesis polyprenyl glycosylphosphotransferase